MDAPDVIYVVRPGARNDALRFSLRSLANLPHHRVFMAGYMPPWVRNVTHVPVHRRNNKFVSIEENLRAAVSHSAIGENAVYFNDDFYIMEPIDEVPVLHDGWAADYKRTGELMWRMKKTIQVLGGAVPPTSYELHVPLPIVTERVWKLMEEIPHGVMWRTWYGNMAHIGGIQINDVKSRDGTIHPGPFLSTSPKAFTWVKEHLEDALPQGGPYV